MLGVQFWSLAVGWQGFKVSVSSLGLEMTEAARSDGTCLADCLRLQHQWQGRCLGLLRHIHTLGPSPRKSL